MNPYIPMLARVVKVKDETPDVKTFRFRFVEKRMFNFIPGQVLMASVFGVGEATFGIVPAEREDEYDFTVKKVGAVTSALFRLKKGSEIGIRGPFGNGYPVKKMRGKNILLIAGGVGFPPIKALLLYLLKDRDAYGRVELYYGAKTPVDIIYKKEIEEWKKRNDLKVAVTVDKATGSWEGHVGVVTTLLEDVEVDKNTLAFVCGPEIMMKFVTLKLKERGLSENKIYASMERLMNCGVGACGHCNIAGIYLCKDGPVVRVDRLLSLEERAW